MRLLDQPAADPAPQPAEQAAGAGVTPAPHRWVDRHAVEPDLVAVAHGAHRWSYRWLSEAANRVAEVLARREVASAAPVGLVRRPSAAFEAVLVGAAVAAGGADESSDRPASAVVDPAAGYPTCGASNRVTGGVDAGMTAGRPMPTQDDVLGYFNTLSNWGRWGDDDELGTLNHITDDVRLAAARAVRHGRSVSCA